MPKPSVIVISSLVARGAVGGRASVFVLERMGFPVIFVPTVVLPWHPGHGRATRITPETLAFASLVADLAGASWLGEVGAVLTGYFADAAQVEAAARLVAAVRVANPAATYFCDPIVGDSNGLFVPEPVAVAIRDRLLPTADIAKPNRFEFNWFAGRVAPDNRALAAAARMVGPKEVIVTSAFAEPAAIANLAVTNGGADLAAHRELPSVPHGTGDLFCALYLAHRLGGAAAADALARTAGAVLRLVELAATLGVDEMPLAEGQDAFTAMPAGIAMSRIAG